MERDHHQSGHCTDSIMPCSMAEADCHTRAQPCGAVAAIARASSKRQRANFDLSYEALVTQGGWQLDFAEQRRSGHEEFFDRRLDVGHVDDNGWSAVARKPVGKRGRGGQSITSGVDFGRRLKSRPACKSKSPVYESQSMWNWVRWILPRALSKLYPRRQAKG
jgi:hypothetical protein